jgi:hypothetical protein
MHKFLFGFFFLCGIGLHAQHALLFYNPQQGKEIRMQVGHKACILYKGYLGQIEIAKETVTDITDSTIVLGVNLAEKMPALAGKPGKRKTLTYKVIKHSDIIGFRRMTIGRQVAKIGLTAAGLVGSFYLVSNVYRGDFTTLQAFGISLAGGVAFVWLNNALLPENIKYYMDEGWQVKLIKQY